MRRYVLAFFGRPVKRAELRRVMESSDLGTPGFKVLNLRRYGYEVTYAAATDERVLIQALADGVPPIVLLHTTSLPYWGHETAHAVVVIAADADVVVFNDPAFPLCTSDSPTGRFYAGLVRFGLPYTLWFIPHKRSIVGRVGGDHSEWGSIKLPGASGIV